MPQILCDVCQEDLDLDKFRFLLCGTPHFFLFRNALNQCILNRPWVLRGLHEADGCARRVSRLQSV